MFTHYVGLHNCGQSRLAYGGACDPASTPHDVCAQAFPISNVIHPRTIKTHTTEKAWNRGYCIIVIIVLKYSSLIPVHVYIFTYNITALEPVSILEAIGSHMTFLIVTFRSAYPKLEHAESAQLRIPLKVTRSSFGGVCEGLRLHLNILVMCT